MNVTLKSKATGLQYRSQYLSGRSADIMDIFRTRFYRVNVRLLTLIGQWPYQDRKKQKIQQVLFQISVITVMLSQGIKLVEIWGDIDIMIECLTPMGVQLGACIKSINCIINRDKMTNLLEFMKRDWSNLSEDETEILTKYAEQGRRLTLLYTGFLYGTIVLYLTIPLMPRLFDIVIPLNESRPHTYLYQTQYYVDPEEYFYPILFHTYCGTLITVSTVIAADTMFACYVQHACGILAVIGHRLENLSEGIDCSKADDKCYRKLILCISQHFKAVEFVSLIESTYSTAYLLVIGTSMGLLSISAVQLLIKFGQYEEMIRLVQFNLAQCIHLLFNSWPGQKLLDQSISFRDSVYFTEWYSLSSRTQKLLRIVMLQTIKPQKITAGKLYDMSMENFGKVMQTSASYFTVFASLR